MLKTARRLVLFSLLLVLMVHICPSSTAIDASSSPSSFHEERASGVSGTLHNVRTSTALFKYGSNAGINFHSPVVTVEKGEVLISTDKETILKTPNVVITIPSKIIGLVSVGKCATSVRNVWEESTDQIQLSVTGSASRDCLASGDEIMIGNNEACVQNLLRGDGMGRKAVRAEILQDGRFVQRAKFPISALLRQSVCLAELVGSKSTSDKQIFKKIYKRSEEQEIAYSYLSKLSSKKQHRMRYREILLDAERVREENAHPSP